MMLVMMVLVIFICGDSDSGTTWVGAIFKKVAPNNWKTNVLFQHIGCECYIFSSWWKYHLWSNSGAGNDREGHPNNPCDYGDNLAVDLGPSNG